MGEIRPWINHGWDDDWSVKTLGFGTVPTVARFGVADGAFFGGI